MVKKVINTVKKVKDTIKTWKYAVVFGREYEEEDLNELGKEGWELCTVLIDPMDPLTKIYYFKREYQYVKKMKGGINMSKNTVSKVDVPKNVKNGTKVLKNTNK